MARLSRATQSLFGSTAGANQIAEYGSYAAGSPATYSGSTITPAIIQALPNYAEGWFGSTLGVYSPAIEDLNALDYLWGYQLTYLMQEGVPEWDSATTYYIGNFVNSSGLLYVSITNSNLNNAVSSTANWKLYSPTAPLSVVTFSSSPVSISASLNGTIYQANTTSGSITFNLPSPATAGAGFGFHIVDTAGTFGTNAAILAPNASELIVGLNANYNMNASWGAWNFYTDGTNWFIKR